MSICSERLQYRGAINVQTSDLREHDTVDVTDTARGGAARDR